MNQSEEHRNFPRVQFKKGVAIEDDSQIMPGKIEDLTVDGICFQIDSELEVGSKIFVDFIQSEEIENTQLSAEVVRCLASKESGYQIAAKFNNVNDRFLMDILAMINGPHQKEE